MGATDQPHYNGFCVTRDSVIMAFQCTSRQALFTSTSGIPAVSLKTSCTSFGSSNVNHEYDPISFEVLAGSQSLHSGNIHPSSRFQCISF